MVRKHSWDIFYVREYRIRVKKVLRHSGHRDILGQMDANRPVRPKSTLEQQRKTGQRDVWDTDRRKAERQ
ncbi:hypothetical protein KI387_043937 [Taxus chinensis]|uniref:Uncharacterized protein n=1 Tax=Taxus chinensis TaxID=29808 RepID=A0AA38GBB7_TAXCH|nr:hypothetical protein KI387_043937 [Taxus chinensis]